MYKKIAGFSLMSLFLVGCDQNISATVYARDIEEILASQGARSVPIDITIEVLESGLARKCAQSEGKELVEAVATVFAKASLVGCEKVSGSLNDRMLIRATTLLFSGKAGHPIHDEYLLGFAVLEMENGSPAVSVTFNPKKYQEVQRRLRDVNSMASVKLSDATISMVMNNDQREPITALFWRGVFVDGKPADHAMSQELQPRQEVTVKLGDVKLAYLTQSGSAPVFGIDTEKKQNLN